MSLSLPANARVDLCADVETAGFGGKVHCIAAIRIQTGEIFRFADAPGYASLAVGVALLENADSVIGHNFLAFDIPRLVKYHNAKIDGNKVCDTLLATRILWPDLRNSDAAANTIPVREYGKHSLRAWGHRLNCQKGDFSEWGQFSTTMMEYCVNDCITTWALYEHIRDATDRTGL